VSKRVALQQRSIEPAFSGSQKEQEGKGGVNFRRGRGTTGTSDHLHKRQRERGRKLQPGVIGTGPKGST